MYDILLVTHGRLGEELLATAHMVYGEVGEGVSAVGFAPGESPDALLGQIRSVAADAKEGCLVLCDIVGGSPFLMAARAYQELRDSHSIEVLSGLNLGMLLEALASRDASSLAEGKRAALDGVRQSICDLSERLG